MDYLRKLPSVLDRHMPSEDVLYRATGQFGDLDLDGTKSCESQMATHLTLAAVLVPIITHDNEPTILLTRRAEHLEQHSGQVAFPGGKVEASDASPKDAALREAYEEVGLEPARVQVHGYLDTYETGTGFRILPVVGFIRPGFSLKLDDNEVAETFEVPLPMAMEYSNYQAREIEWQGQQRLYYSMQYEGYHIWGATAAMLRHMSQRLRDQ